MYLVLKTGGISADVGFPLMKCQQSIKLRSLPYRSASLYPLAESLFMKKSFTSTNVPRLLLFFAERMISPHRKPSKTVCRWYEDPCKNCLVFVFFCMTFDIQDACLFKLFTFIYKTKSWNWIDRTKASWNFRI